MGGADVAQRDAAGAVAGSKPERCLKEMDVSGSNPGQMERR